MSDRRYRKDFVRTRPSRANGRPSDGLELLDHVWLDPRFAKVGRTAQIVLTMAARWANANGALFAGRARWAELLGCSRETVSIALAQLEDERLLREEPYLRPPGAKVKGRGASNFYIDPDLLPGVRRNTNPGQTRVGESSDSCDDARWAERRWIPGDPYDPEAAFVAAVEPHARFDEEPPLPDAPFDEAAAAQLERVQRGEEAPDAPPSCACPSPLLRHEPDCPYAIEVAA